MENDLNKVADVIKAVFERQFAPARVQKILLEPDVDHDGDAIIRAQVVFEVDGDKLDPKKVKGLARHLRSEFEKLNEDRFPVVSFKTSAEFASEAA